MTFRYGEVATPCPPSWGRSDSFSFEDEFDSYEDDTAAIDFTTELSALSTLAKEKPRRIKRATTFKIHEDTGNSGESSGSRQMREAPRPTGLKTLGSRSSMFAQPAQRLPRPSKKVFATTRSPNAQQKKERQEAATLNDESRAPIKRQTLLDDKNDRKAKRVADAVKKDKRRNSIYIPPDDTTMATLFTGICSPMKTLKLESHDEIDNVENQVSQNTQPRKSHAMASPRAPLEQALKPVQEEAFKDNMAGQKTGKENIPPGHSASMECDSKKAKELDAECPKPKAVVRKPKKSISMTAVNRTQERLSAHKQPDTAPQKKPLRQSNSRTSLKRTSLYNKSGVEQPEKILPSTTSITQSNEPSKWSHNSCSADASLRTMSRPAVKRKTPSRPIPPRVKALDLKYPLLEDGISNSSMYEDNWLAHQEVVITQLVNSLFEPSNEPPPIQEGDTVRYELLQIYQNSYFSLLYKRVHASLLYGELRVPRQVCARGNRVKNDIGLRRKFLNLWTETYDHTALQAAAETVVGRKIPITQTKSQTQISSGRVTRRSIETFLDTFILRNEDMDPITAATKAEEGGAAGKAYRKTLLRSIMMIVLLDEARSKYDAILPRRLFKLDSEYKSSSSVLHALGKLLHSAVGDINRPLNRLDCSVNYKQNPLMEYDYRIDNLAVDIRNGIILTRLTEVLLLPTLPSDSTTSATGCNENAPSDLKYGEENWPLSKQLKIPCVSRATKLYNVQTALTALADVPGVGTITGNIRPEDIVDGYREKTIALLWAVVGKWGLSALVDWDDVRREINRLQKEIGVQVHNEKDGNNEDSEEQKQGQLGDEYAYYSSLLRKWASCLAQLRGLQLSNLTTSFADGRIFGSILDEYENLIPIQKSDFGRTSSASACIDGEGSQQNSGFDLETRLVSLGCSSQFASLVAPRNPSKSSTPTHIFDQDFNLAALAFLCSRLLPASRSGRAAVTIQRAWRHVLSIRSSAHTGSR